MFLRRSAAFIFFSLLILNSCKEQAKIDEPADNNITQIAREYVKLVFNVGIYDKDLVDAYFGPESLRTEAGRMGLSLVDIGGRISELDIRLKRIDTTGYDEMQSLRFRYLLHQIQALTARVDILTGTKMPFDEESRLIYDAVSPVYPLSYYVKIIDSLNKMLPGTGSVAEKYNRFRDQFIIPPSRLDTVFKTAINEGRRRTLQHIKLPDNESFTVSFVKGKSWGAYNWFKGNSFSLIEVNTDLPVYIDRAVDLACHEGYPGHHTYHTLVEKNFYKERNWVEFSIYPLFSPQSLISEGTANFGIDMAFPGQERIKFEKEVLFPLAGINPANADLYYKTLELVSRLSYAGNEVARRFLDGKLNKAEAVRWLVNYQMRSPDRAEKFLSFIEQYRAYVINYNLGQDLVKKYIDKRAGNDNEKRWQEFIKLIGRPVLPSDLEQ